MTLGSPGGSAANNLAADAGDTGWNPGSEIPPEKEMATHSSIPAWEIPCTEEPGKLQSTGSQIVRHDLITKQQQMTQKFHSNHTF